MQNRRAILAGAVALGAMSAAASGPARAEDVLKIPNIIEISGAGATSASQWKEGCMIAADEINAKGGILGRKIQFEYIDTASDPVKARAAVQRALDDKPAAIFGPIFSGSVNATLKLTAEAETPQIMGGEAANLTQQGSKYIFRTAFGQQTSMPKIAAYIADDLKAKTVAVIYVNNDFGKGGLNAIKPELEKRGTKVIAELSTEQGQADFAADVVKLKNAKPDVVFAYTNEEESARLLIEAKKQGVTIPFVGETTLLGQKVIDMAKDAANGVRGHVGLSADAPIPAIADFEKKFVARWGSKSDHNGIKGYTAVYLLKAAAEKAGGFDPKKIAAAIHGLSLTVAKEPGILLDASWDDNGDINRVSFLGEVKDGKQVITTTLPALK